MEKWQALWQEYQKYFLFGGGFLVVLLIVLYFGFSSKTEDKLEHTEQTLVAQTKQQTTQGKSKRVKEMSKETSNKIFVDVKGAVKNPGMYPLTNEQRVFDAIQIAGGFQADADQNRINFSELLTDQMIVYVPKKGEEAPKEFMEMDQHTSKKATNYDDKKGTQNRDEVEKVNINTADQKTLETLNGIGEKKALQIIQFREENGSFTAVEDLKKVSGIGDKIFEGLKEQATIE